MRNSVFCAARRAARPANVGKTAGGLLMAAAVLCLGAARPARAQFGDAWDWRLAPRRFSALSQEERVHYSRAEELLGNRSYESAAIEFEKFMVQHPRTPVHSHALLLKGYSLHLARQRKTAIKVYTEVLDLFPDAVDDAAPALYLTAAAHFENGDVDRGVAALKELTGNEKYLQHPIADLALNKLGEYYMGRKDEKNAEACWKKVVQLYSESLVRPEAAAKEARARLMDFYIRKQRYPALEETLAQGIDDPKKLCDVAIQVYERGMSGFGTLSADEKDSLFRWFKVKKRWFIEADRKADFFPRVLDLACRAGARDDWKTFFGDAVKMLDSTPPEKMKDIAPWLGQRLAEAQKAGWKIEEQWKAFGDSLTSGAKALPPEEQLKLYGAVMEAIICPIETASAADSVWSTLVSRSREICKGLFGDEKDRSLSELVDRVRKNPARIEQAFEIARSIENPALSRWKEAELYGQQEKFEEMAKACEDVEKMDDKDLAVRAMKTRASIYKDRLARYEEAIKLYNEINDPPWTAWAVVECYEKWQKPEEAVAMCSEIEGFFENEAPVAAFRKALIWERFGNQAKAIAECRTVLKKYPRHQVSSQAHQMLERYGIKTGGGVTEAED